MTERKKIDLDDVSPEQQELNAEEQEAAKGGATSLPRGTRPGGGSLQSDPCQGGEVSRP